MDEEPALKRQQTPIPYYQQGERHNNREKETNEEEEGTLGKKKTIHSRLKRANSSPSNIEPYNDFYRATVEGQKTTYLTMKLCTE